LTNGLKQDGICFTWKSPDSSRRAETGLSGGRGKGGVVRLGDEGARGKGGVRVGEGGRGKGGVRVGEGELHELPRDETPLEDGDI
jgi:hypothetical protein